MVNIINQSKILNKIYMYEYKMQLEIDNISKSKEYLYMYSLMPINPENHFLDVTTKVGES